MIAIQDLSSAEWQEFCDSRPDIHLLQHATWGDFKAQFGWQAQRIAIRDANTVLGGAQILWRSQWGLKVAYVPRGPVWTNDPHHNAILLHALERIARRRHAIFLRLEPNSLSDQAFDVQHSQLLLAGYHTTTPLQPEASIHLGLSLEEPQLFANFSKGHRADVRRAERLGVTVRIGTTEADLDAFYGLMEITGKRGDFAIHSREYYLQAWRMFGGEHVEGAAHLFLAELDGAVIAAFLVFAVGDEAQYMYSGANEVGLKNAANHALQWTAIRWAKSRGCKLYDFWGIPVTFLELDQAQTAQERFHLEEAAKATGLDGVYRFKKGFGGELVRYVPAYDRVFCRLAYWIWQRRRSSD